MQASIRNLTLIVALAMSAAACADADPSGITNGAETTTAPGTATTISNLGGDLRQVQNPGETYIHGDAHLSGILLLEENGCWKIAFGGERRLVAFPQGFEVGESGVAMVAPDGTEYGDGIAVDATGGPSSLASLPGAADGYWGDLISFCDPSATEIVVLEGVEPAYDPTALSEDELAELVHAAELTKSWPCGLGFTLSTEDERVVLYLEPTELYVAATPPITFPDDDWSGRIVVGKNLLVNHCDDVAEYWEPDLVVAASWELTGGVLDFEPPAEIGFDACGTSGPVTATLEGGTINTPRGEIVLDDLTMVNEAYGCFAG